MGDLRRRVDFTLNGQHISLQYEQVETALRNTRPEPVRTHGVQINGLWFPVKQAFEVATSVPRSDFTSHTARRHLSTLGFEVAGDIKVRESEAPPPRATEPSAPAAESAGTIDLLLVTCVKEKADRPAAARDLYTSTLFRKERAYAERSTLPWFILSAEHGLVAPDEWLAPYERYLPDTSPEYRRAWGEWVAARLELLVGPLDGRTIELHASSSYAEAVRGPIRQRGASLLEPLAGLPLGSRLAWYDEHSTSAPLTAASSEAGHESAATFCRDLSDPTRAVSPEEFQARGSHGYRVPGLYSWWADEEGARDLSIGLDHEVNPGLIYAGLAGATRWPSGKRSTNTLWSRIDGMHLGSRHEFSTFRRTIGSILAHQRGAETIDEVALTAWMRRHLRVLAIPFDDADTLGRLEEDVLSVLDPPLNLKGIAPSPIRTRLRTLRSRYSST